MAELQQLPGIGPFYIAMIVVRACGHADAFSMAEDHSRGQRAQVAYGIDHELSDGEFADLAGSWRPFRTWVAVMLSAVGSESSATGRDRTR
jgi:DNA-3-methyladenine glycosylase II